MDFSKVSIGVNTSNINLYLEKIQTEVIEKAISVLTDKQSDLFDVFRENWKGVAEQNFETNMKSATEEIKKSLQQHYEALSQKINAINNSWIQQDADMVKINGGN